jgi:xanthine dehydrogenase accessory factor
MTCVMHDLPFGNIRIAILGGGDLGSGVAYRLYRAGFGLLITELAEPLLVRRAVAFGSAVREGQITVEGITAVSVTGIASALEAQGRGMIPVLVDPEGSSLGEYDPAVLVDARMRKTDPGHYPVRPRLVIGLGPGFMAPLSCDAVIETQRGHYLGRVIRQGAAEPDTGTPGSVMGVTSGRVLRAPVGGAVRSLAAIGVRLESGQPVAQIGSHIVEAPFRGVLRGLVHDGVCVPAGTKIADIDPRADPDHCFTISDKSLAVGGGVLEAILSSEAIRAMVHAHR